MSTTTGEMRKYKVTDQQGSVYILDPVDTEARQQIDDAELIQFDDDYFTSDEDTTNKEVNIGLNGVPLGVDDTLKFVQDSQDGIVLGINSDVEDSGKVLTVNSSGEAVWGNAPPELPPSTASDENKVLRVNDQGNAVWSPMETDIFGSITDDEGDDIQDEEGNSIGDENSVELWTSFNGTGFGAERAVADADGNNIAETYAKKGEASSVTTSYDALTKTLTINI